VPWQVGTLAEAAALAALSDRDHAARTLELVETERQWLLEQLAGLDGLRLAEGAANFLFAETDRPAREICDWFLDRRILLRNCTGLPGVDGEILREDLELLEVFNRLIKEAEKEIATLMGEDPRVTLLRTVPGLGPILAAVVALEIDHIERFSLPSKLASYAGLVPSTYASGGRIFHGKLIPMTNKWLRGALVEAAWGAIRKSPYCSTYFEAHKRHKGPHTAAIALARRLIEIIWHVLMENRNYEERLPRAHRLEKAAAVQSLSESKSPTGDDPRSSQRGIAQLQRKRNINSSPAALTAT